LGFGNDPNGTRREKVWAVVVYHMHWFDVEDSDF
jgi:hypothetical protein